MASSDSTAPFNNKSTVYGPVTSWRFGRSLGVDPIFELSTCSFNCIYCQLGDIQKVTRERRVYVATETVLRDMREFLSQGKDFDVITYSGSGEPTLAANLSQLIAGIRTLSPHKPQYILSNATELELPEVRRDLTLLDKVMLKLDAWDEATFRRINRPAAGVTFDKVVAGLKKFSREFSGDWEIQTMLMPINQDQEDAMVALFKELSPKAIALNTPKRPYPLSWHRENRGNHLGIFNYPVSNLKTIDVHAAARIEQRLRSELSCPIYSVYR